MKRFQIFIIKCWKKLLSAYYFVGGARVLSAELTNRGLIRERNEDAVLSRPALGLWAVADGMGGHKAGDVASKKVVEALDNMPKAKSYAEFLNQIETCLQETNTALNTWSHEHLGGQTVGSTVAVLVKDDKQVSCLWVGDSRVYRYRRGQFVALTEDHTIAFQLVDEGTISLEEAEDHPGKHILTQAIGSGTCKVAMQHYSLLKGDRYLLCSDGLYGELSADEMVAGMKDLTPQEAVAVLLDEALRKGARDNVSIIIVDT